jgi:hypothetical protein
MDINLFLGRMIISTKRFPSDSPTSIAVLLSKDTQITSKHGKSVTFRDLLEPGNILSVEYYITAGGSKIALTISKPDQPQN